MHVPDSTWAPPVAAHRLLGDGTTTALLRPAGEIDWWCAPAMDSPPLLWSLLDADGATAHWHGVRLAAAVGRAAGPVLTTVLQSSRGRIEGRDGLHCDDDRGPSLIRLVRGLDEDLDVEHELSLGGFDQPQAEWDGAEARVAGLQVCVLGGVSQVDGRVLRTRAVPTRGEWTAVVVTLDPVRTADVPVLQRLLDEAEREDEEVLRQATLPRTLPHRAAEALRVLRLCTFAPTGAVVASPTTSLPEAPGHDCQFDYRYTWLRDASLLPGVVGWGASRPVRVGNVAQDQVQHDALGLLVEAVSVHVQTGGRLTKPVWRVVRSIADALSAEGLERRTSGIWELREPADLVGADIGVWLALDRAVWIARGWRPWTRRARWLSARDAAKARVTAAIGPDGGLPQVYGGEPRTADASALMAVVFGMFGREDPRASALVDATLRELDCAPFLYRYQPGGDDGFSGVEGAFLPASWWVVAALAPCGWVDEAEDRARALDRAVPALMPEEMDPESRVGLGNVPLVWSHMEAARAMYLLDAARLRRRFGPAALAAWRGQRWLRSQWR